MLKIKNILIPTDFSETAQLAISHGVKMAHLFNARLFLLHSVEMHYYLGSPDEPVMVTESETIFKKADQKLHETGDEIAKKYGLEVTVLMVKGKPAAGIVKVVKEYDIDVIVMGTHGASGFDEFFLGSNAHKVVHLAPCPVITVQTIAVKTGFNNIVMPIDDTLHSRQKVNNVIEIAGKYNSKVHILGLLATSDTADEKKLEIKIESVEKLLKTEHIPYLKKMVHGRNLAVEAMNYSQEGEADLIVIMTDHESELTGMFLGTFAKQIVNHSKIPVMSIRPAETTLEDFNPYGGTGEI